MDKEDSSFEVAVLGAGSWGTALAHHLSRNGHRAVLWGRNRDILRCIQEERKNPKYFPNDWLAPFATEGRLDAVFQRRLAVVVFALPSTELRTVARQIGRAIGDDVLVVNAAKGLEGNTLKRMTEVLADELGSKAKICVLSGPSFALEVLRGLPTAVTIASSDITIATAAASYFHGGTFRVYTSTDVIGVELGGVVKNSIALAAGVVDGLGYGNNARAALITRGIAEMQRLIVTLHGEAQTVSGLSGLGDLLLTATGDLSRNRRVGLSIGKGEKLPDILANLGQVAEAVFTTPELLKLAQRNNVSVPIIEQVAKILAGETTPGEAAVTLLSRQQKEENLIC